MIAEPLTSEIVLGPRGIWAAVILDNDGAIPSVDQDEWYDTVLTGLMLIERIRGTGQLTIVHPPGYGR